MNHLYVSKKVAQNINQRVEYSRHKGLGSKSCERLLVESLNDHGTLARQDIDRLLWNVLSDQLTDKQKKAKITNLLTKLRKDGILSNKTAGRNSTWKLTGKQTGAN